MDTGTIQNIENEIVDEFSVFDEWMDKYEYIIEMGKTLPHLDEKYKTEEKKETKETIRRDRECIISNTQDEPVDFPAGFAITADAVADALEVVPFSAVLSFLPFSFDSFAAAAVAAGRADAGFLLDLSQERRFSAIQAGRICVGPEHDQLVEQRCVRCGAARGRSGRGSARHAARQAGGARIRLVDWPRGAEGRWPRPGIRRPSSDERCHG